MSPRVPEMTNRMQTSEMPILFLLERTCLQLVLFLRITILISVFSRGWLFEKERVVTKRDVPFDKATSALAKKSFLVMANLNSSMDLPERSFGSTKKKEEKTFGNVSAITRRSVVSFENS